MLIAILGAECTGKSCLAQSLVTHFGGVLVPEYLRSFCHDQGRTPTASEQASILQAQCAQETQVLSRRPAPAMIFCDTAALQTAVYSEYYFSDTSLHAQARQWHTRFALTLLMMPDLPWVSDHFLRDGATAQSAVHRLLVRELASQQGVVTVSGTGLARLNSAINAIQEQMPLQCAAHRGCAPQGALRNTPFT